MFANIKYENKMQMARFFCKISFLLNDKKLHRFIY